MTDIELREIKHNTPQAIFVMKRAPKWQKEQWGVKNGDELICIDSTTFFNLRLNTNFKTTPSMVKFKEYRNIYGKK